MRLYAQITEICEINPDLFYLIWIFIFKIMCRGGRKEFSIRTEAQEVII